MSMQLQPGKWYRQRDGGKAYVAAELPEEFCRRTCRRFIGVDSEYEFCAWLEDGHYGEKSPIATDQFDLIAEWVDEPTDAEVAEAVRWCCEQAAQFYPCNSPRQFVDAVNEYRAREGA